MEKPLQTSVYHRMFARITFLLVACTSMLVPDESGLAQTYPNGKPIRLVSGAGPGSASDIVGRAVGETFRSELGVPVDTREPYRCHGRYCREDNPIRAPGRPYILVQSGAHTIARIRDERWTMIRCETSQAWRRSHRFPNVLVVAASAGFRAVSDLVATAKGKPGGSILDQVGTGSATFMSAVKFNRAAGLTVVHVPFKGAVDAITETLTGRIDYIFAPLVSALPLIQDGKLRPLAVNTTKRISQLPDVPTLAKRGLQTPTMFSGRFAGLLADAKRHRAEAESGRIEGPTDSRPARALSRSWRGADVDGPRRIRCVTGATNRRGRRKSSSRRKQSNECSHEGPGILTLANHR